MLLIVMFALYFSILCFYQYLDKCISHAEGVWLDSDISRKTMSILLRDIRTSSVITDSSRSPDTILECYLAEGSWAASKEFPFWPIQGISYSPPNILPCICPFLLRANTAELMRCRSLLVLKSWRLIMPLHSMWRYYLRVRSITSRICTTFSISHTSFN